MALRETIQIVSNVWCKMMKFENVGDFIEGHRHKFDHQTLLAKGKFNVILEGKDPFEVTAPAMLFIKKGLLHEFHAIERDSLAFCIHPIRDGERVEDILDSDSNAEMLKALETYGFVETD